MEFTPPVSAPDPGRFVDTDLLRTLYKALGIAIVVQWFIPWMGSVFSWDLMNFGAGFAMVWALLGGAGFIALGFVPEDKLSDNLRVVIGAGIGVLGLISLTTLAGGTPPGVPFFGFFGWMGLVTASLGLFLWSRRGHSPLAWYLVLGGVGAMALWLLIPIDGTMPLVYLFKVFGVAGINIIWRIFMFALMLGFIGIGVLAVLFVILPKDGADAAWVRLLAWASLAYVPAALLVLGVMAMFTSAWALIAMLHLLIMAVTWLVPTVLAGSIVLEHAADGTLPSLFR